MIGCITNTNRISFKHANPTPWSHKNRSNKLLNVIRECLKSALFRGLDRLLHAATNKFAAQEARGTNRTAGTCFSNKIDNIDKLGQSPS
jgi:hypothetical protein